MKREIEYAAELLLIKSELDKSRAYYLLDNEQMCAAALHNSMKMLTELVRDIISPDNRIFLAK